MERTLHYDAVVVGVGYVGVACARQLAAAGRKVLLVARDAGLLWETGRALWPDAHCGEDARWRGLRDEVRCRTGCATLLAPAVSEVVGTRLLLEESPGVEVRYFSWPVEGEWEQGALRTVTLVGKGCRQKISADRWIDATETGELLETIGVRLPGARRSPREHFVAVGYHTPQARPLPRQVALARFPAVSVEVRDGGQPDLWLAALRLPAGCAWTDPDTRGSILADLARAIGADGEKILLTHASVELLALYGKSGKPAAPRVVSGTGLVVAAPAWVDGDCDGLAERVALGLAAATAVESGTGGSDRAERMAAPMRHETTAVAVCGAGTSGVFAALSAAATGQPVVCIEPTGAIGGVGSHGFINGYCAGVRTGWFQQFDRAAAALSQQFGAAPVNIREGTPQNWHYLARDIVLEQACRDRGIRVWRQALAHSATTADGRVVAVDIATPDGALRLEARAWVDTTGDGDLCIHAGARARPPARVDALPLGYTLNALALHAEEGRRTFTNCNYDAGWVDATDAVDLTRARLEGVRTHLRDRYDRFWPLVLSPQVGLRQSRHIETEAMVTLADLVAGRAYPDAIGSAKTYLDTHAIDFESEGPEPILWWWICQSFFQPIGTTLPYRMLLPRGLRNVWVAGRCAGIAPEAANGLRMQSDMQRLGEAAGLAAALYCNGALQDSRQVPVGELRRHLAARASVSFDPPSGMIGDDEQSLAAGVAALEAGRPNGHLWVVHTHFDKVEAKVRAALQSADPQVSWLAACLLAIRGDESAESRLLAAVASREPRDASRDSIHGLGAWDEEILVPNWVLALVLLRFCGTRRSLAVLSDVLAREAASLFNLRTIVGTSLEELVRRGVVGAEPAAWKLLDDLLDALPADRVRRPMRSLARQLRGEPQKTLWNDRGAVVEHDMTWQLQLTVARTARLLGRPLLEMESVVASDSRGFVRQALARIESRG